MKQYDYERGETKWKAYDGPAPTLPPVARYLGDLTTNYLEDRDLEPKLAGVNGWYPADMDVPRLVIPCTNSAGTVYYQARRMDYNPKLRYDSPSAPRGDSVVIVYPIGYYRVRCCIVEGPMDALASAAFGFVGIATMGNQPAREALEFVVDKFGRTHAPFLIVPDKDSEDYGGYLAATFGMLGVRTEVKLLTGGKDICELDFNQRQKFFGIQKGSHGKQ